MKKFIRTTSLILLSVFTLVYYSTTVYANPIQARPYRDTIDRPVYYPSAIQEVISLLKPSEPPIKANDPEHSNPSTATYNRKSSTPATPDLGTSSSRADIILIIISSAALTFIAYAITSSITTTTPDIDGNTASSTIPPSKSTERKPLKIKIPRNRPKHRRRVHQFADTAQTGDLRKVSLKLDAYFDKPDNKSE